MINEEDYQKLKNNNKNIRINETCVYLELDEDDYSVYCSNGDCELDFENNCPIACGYYEDEEVHCYDCKYLDSILIYDREIDVFCKNKNNESGECDYNKNLDCKYWEEKE